MLIAMRALLGVAGATLALHVPADPEHVPRPHERQFAISVWITSYSVGGAIGPLVGGALLQYFWWGSVFLLAVPVMVLLLVLGPTSCPNTATRTPDGSTSRARRFAVRRAGADFGLKQIAQHGSPFFQCLPFDRDGPSSDCSCAGRRGSPIR